MKNYLIAYRRCLSFALSTLILITCCISSYASWDGYVEETSDYGEQIVTVVDMNQLSIIMQTTGSPSSKVKRSAMYTTRWNNHKAVGSISFPVPRDWSKYEKLIVPIYSAAATNAKVTMVIQCDYEPSPTAQSSYWQYPFNINWTGWKVFEINIREEFQQYNNASLSKVNRLLFSGNGWGAVPHENSDLYFDTITAHLGDDTSDMENKITVKSFSTVEVNEFKNAMKGAIALYNFTNKVYYDGDVREIDKSGLNTTTKDGVVMANVSVFNICFNAEIESNGNSRTIEIDGKVLEVTAEKVEFSINGNKHEFSTSPFIEEDTFYVPINECARAIGKSAQTFGLLTIIGSDEHIKTFQENKKLREIGAYVINSVKIDPHSVTEEDFAKVKENWRKYLVGDTSNDLTNPYIKNLIKQIDSSANAAWNSMNRSPDAKVLFGTKEVVTTDDMGKQYGFMWKMAQAYGTYGSTLYKNPQLKSAILYALEWLYQHYYGQGVIDGTGWRDIFLYNWWDWYVHVPNYLTQTLFILEPEMLQSDIEKYLAPFDYIRTVMRTGKNLTNAQSRLYVVTALAVLQENVDLMLECMQDFDRVLQITNSGDGVHEDFSYINHTYYPIEGMYGVAVLIDRLMNTASILAGTKFEITSAEKYNQALWIYHTFEPVVYRGTMMAMQNGRSPAEGLSYGRGVVKGALNLIGCFGKDDDLRLKMIVKRHVTEESLPAVISTIGKIYLANKLLEIMNDKTLPEPEEYIRAMVRYKSDRVVQHRGDYAVGIAMSSSRIGNYESINGVNKKGWYTGDGMVYVYNHQTNGLYDQYGSNFFSNANMYRMPGTTEDTQEREEASISSAYLPNRDFVGGVEFEGLYATVAMDFEAYHWEEEDNRDDTGYGGGFPQHFSDLTAKKSWFLFDDEIVAVGSAINSTNNAEVNTYVDNRELRLKLTLSDEQSNNNSYEPYEIVSVSAAGHDGNVPENVIDNNFDTRWSFEASSNGWLILELEEPKPIGYVSIAQYGGIDGRQAIFDIELSVDGVTWEKVFSGKASGQTEALESYDCKGVVAKYVKYVGSGRTNSFWNSITEMKVYPPTPDGKIPTANLLSTPSNIIYGAEDIYVDGVLLEKAKSITNYYTNPTWVHLQNFGGYYFPKGGNVTLNKTDAAISFFELWLSHGTKPVNEKYAYVMLPNKTPEQTKEYAENPDVTILEYSEKIHAVHEKNLGITGIVFWERGSYAGITVSEPMIVMFKEKDGEFVISVADPTHKLKEATVTIDKELSLVSKESQIAEGLGKTGNRIAECECNKHITIEPKANATTFTVNFDGLNGKTVTAKFIK